MKKTRIRDCSFGLLLLALLGSSAQFCFAETDNGKKSTAAVQLDFDVTFDQSVDASNAGQSGSVVAHLKNDLKFNGKLIALAGSVVKGRVEAIDKNGNVIDPNSAAKHLSRNMPFRIVFDRVVSADNHVLKIHALATKQSSIFNNGNQVRSIDVIAGGVVKRAESLASSDSIRLLAGDELSATIISDKYADTSAGRQNTESDATKKAAAPGLVLFPKASEELGIDLSKPANSDDDETESPATEKTTQHSASSKSMDLPVPDSAKHSQGSVDSAWLKENSTDFNAPASAAGSTAVIQSNLKSSNSTVAAGGSSELTVDESSKSESFKTSESASAAQDKPASANSKTHAKAEHAKGENESKAQTSAASKNQNAQEDKKNQSNKFRVVLRTPIYSKSAKPGTPTRALLLTDLKFDRQVIAKKGSEIFGHVDSVRPSCHWGSAIVAKDQRFQRSASLKISFYKVVTPEGKQISISGFLPEQSTVFNNGGFKEVDVSQAGEMIKDGSVDAVSNNPLTGVGTTILKTAQMGPAAIVAMPLMVAGALGKVAPNVGNSFQKTFMSKGDEIYVVPGDELFIQAIIRKIDGQKFVSGKIIDASANIDDSANQEQVAAKSAKQND